jgi:hypothetical protein
MQHNAKISQGSPVGYASARYPSFHRAPGAT